MEVLKMGFSELFSIVGSMFSIIGLGFIQLFKKMLGSKEKYLLEEKSSALFFSTLGEKDPLVGQWRVNSWTFMRKINKKEVHFVVSGTLSILFKLHDIDKWQGRMYLTYRRDVQGTRRTFIFFAKVIERIQGYYFDGVYDVEIIRDDFQGKGEVSVFSGTSCMIYRNPPVENQYRFRGSFTELKLNEGTNELKGFFVNTPAELSQSKPHEISFFQRKRWHEVHGI
uniref:Uncharacterized protein n=1 Tax=Magnetococcus massalia (strain MO-1) TaxID=451514 RepID=A0A1S7LE58_MAGMO|nr:Protein of unknown function [Candidatus Magnetococcus massalia]